MAVPACLQLHVYGLSNPPSVSSSADGLTWCVHKSCNQVVSDLSSLITKQTNPNQPVNQPTNQTNKKKPTAVSLFLKGNFLSYTAHHCKC